MISVNSNLESVKIQQTNSISLKTKDSSIMEKSRKTIQPKFSAKESRSSKLMGSCSKGGTSMKIMSLEEEDGLEVVQKRYILEIS